MIKIQKTDKDGKIREFWELTEEDKAKMKAEIEAAKKRREEMKAKEAAETN